MIQTENWDGVEVYKLENNELSIWIAPSLGANLFRIKDKKKGLEILRTPKSSTELRDSAIYWGNPVLFPPNRIRKGEFSFEGQHYNFPINTLEGHHIHGLVLGQPWRFDTLSDTDETAQFTCSFDFMDYPDVLQSYPNHLKLEMTFQLLDRSITQTLRISNRGKNIAPIGYGLHTWFLLSGGAQRWKLTVPFESIWELGDDVMPTGKMLTPGRLAPLRTGFILGEHSFDTAFFIGNLSHAVRLVRDDGYTIVYEVGDEFLHWVVHTPSDNLNVIAIEPYTWITDAPHLTNISENTGLQALQPGTETSFTTRLLIGC